MPDKVDLNPKNWKITKPTISESVEVVKVQTYRSAEFMTQVDKADDMVRLTVDMPLWLWRRNHKFLNVDDKGKPLGCGRQGCKTRAPKGVAVNGKCICKG